MRSSTRSRRRGAAARSTRSTESSLIVYQSTKDGFLDDAFKHDIEDVILASFKARTGRSVAKAEIRSWKESLLAMAKVLNGCTVPADVGVAIEYGIPQTAKRIDLILSGKER